MIRSASSPTFKVSSTKLVLGFFKFVIFTSTLLLFLLHHSLIDLILRNQKLKFKYFMWSITRTSKLALKILNVKVELVGVRGEVQKKLIVANHLSYLDVLILFSHFPSLFITSVEIKETFLLGRICKLAGCFFVERRKEKRNPDTKSLELKEISRQFDNEFNIFLFPEGTSSNGVSILPFKSTFFQLAIDTNTFVQPICLKYQGESRDVPPWYGDMTFADHLFRLCCETTISAEITLLPQVFDTERTALAEKCHISIKECYDKN